MKKLQEEAPSQSASNGTPETNVAVPATTNKINELDEWVHVSHERASFHKYARNKSSHEKAGDAHADGPVMVCTTPPSYSK